MSPISNPKQTYQKPWVSWPDQVAKLESRGLVIEDKSAAEKFLSRINYYRFSGYCLPFESARHRFSEETSFGCIRLSYEFDCSLRKLFGEVLEIIEIHLRTTFAYKFSQLHGPMGHTDSNNFFTPKPSKHAPTKDQFVFNDWIRNTKRECKRAKELFVEHFKVNYDGFPDLPIWVTTEIMSFGNLSRMYKGMLKSDRKSIASSYGLQPNDLENWIHHLVYVRNTCAHHARLWDREWHIKPNRLHAQTWNSSGIPTNSRLFITLLILNHMIKKCGVDPQLVSQWKGKIQNLIDKPPPIDNAMFLMGLPSDWQSHVLWK